MKSFSPTFMAALEAGEAVTAGAVKIATADPFRVWSGYGDIVLEGETYVGIGELGLVKSTASQLGGAEQAIELVLPSIDPAIIPIVQAIDVAGAAVTIWRLGFDVSGTQLLAALKFAQGSVDALPTEETPGGDATVRCRVETAVRGAGRATGRTRSDSDRRRIEATDGGERHITAAPGRELHRAGKPPARAGQALPGLTVGQQYAGRFTGVDLA